MKKNKYLFLAAILVVAALLRLWSLGSVPISLNWDEVALGYNAYSILETGRDEYGEFLPVVLRSYNDYKPALYTYLTIPSVAIFGLTPFAVRLPAALSGILAVFLTYILVCELFGVKKIKIGPHEISGEMIALLAAFLLAISPWHIQFSRVAFEANVAVTFNLLALTTFFIGLRRRWFILLTPIFLSLSVYTYQSAKLFVPVLFVLMTVIFWKKLVKVDKKFLAAAVMLGVVVSLPMSHFLLTDPNALSRAQGVGVFSSNTTELLKDTVVKLEVDRSRGDVLGLIFDNRRVEFAKAVTDGYLSHFDINWLFIEGDLERHHAPGMGLLYLWELPFLLIGIYTLIFMPIDRRVKVFILLWFLCAPLPAALTTGLPHAVRTLNFLPTFQIFVALGLVASYSYLYKHRITFLIGSSALFLIIIFNFVYYLNQYFVQQNYEYALDWQYGYKQMVENIQPVSEKYEKIVVSNDNEMAQSYMFFLFYTKYNPSKYLEEGGTNSGSFDDPHKFSNFEFREFDYDTEAKNQLLIGSKKDFEEEYKTIHAVYYPDSELAIRAVETK